MSTKELAFAKHGALAAKQWDTFQAIIRQSLKHLGTVRKKKSTLPGKLLLLCLGCQLLAIPAPESLAMTRTLKKDPAIVIVAFGTTTEARVTFDFFDRQLRNELPSTYQGYKITWAFTSEIVRERANKKFTEAGINKHYYSLPQILANLEDEGYRKIAIQPLYIFPGQEYEEMERAIQAFRQIGLRIEYGGPLLHRWDSVHETITILEKEFLPPEKGCNILISHGTPLTDRGSNSTYLGLERYLDLKYQNVTAGSIEGILTREQAMSWANKTCQAKRVRFIPFLYVAGDHVMNDIMAPEPDEEGQDSWSRELTTAGFAIDTPHSLYQGVNYFKGLGFYPEINHEFIQQLLNSIQRIETH